MNKQFISYDKYLVDDLALIDLIVKDEFVDDNTIIIVYDPGYSSTLGQLCNHKLSYLNGNELFEVVNLPIPPDNMTQVWDGNEQEYKLFDPYLSKWITKNLEVGFKYLVVGQHLRSAKYINKLTSYLTKNGFDFRTGFVYLCPEVDFKPTFHVEQLKKDPLYEWENSNRYE